MMGNILENSDSVNIQMAPLRSVSDFIYPSARFNLPSFKGDKKLIKRVNDNLLYYQTNYFIIAIIVFFIIGFANPGKWLYGMIAMSMIVTITLYAFNNQPNMRLLRNNHPYISFIIIFLIGYFTIYWLDCVSIFLLSIFLPLFLVLTHSLVRTRNLENKIVNKAESIGFTKTPMGVLLSFIDNKDI